MRFTSSIALLTLALAVGGQNAAAQQAEPSIQTIAQACDRCMATYAVRLTRTPASDEAIYAEAAQGCLPLKTRLVDAIRAQVPPAEAAPVLASLETSAKPNFMAMLARIRSDRAKRESQPGGQ